jgi:hypothetical protein
MASWTPPITISPKPGPQGPYVDLFPKVAIDDTGNAVFAWRAYSYSRELPSGVFGRVASASGHLGPLLTLATRHEGQNSSPDEPDVAVDAKGHALFTWSYGAFYRRIQMRERFAGGGLGPVRTISPPGGNASEPQVATNADGDGVFVWTRFDGTYDRIQARQRSAGGALGPVQNVSPAGGDAAQPKVAVDRHGDAVLLWQHSDGSHWRVQARALSATGALGPVQNLGVGTPPLFHGSGTNSPQVGVDSHGGSVFVWKHTNPSGTEGIQARTRAPAGALGPVENLSAPDQDAGGPQVAVDPAGDAVFTWEQQLSGPLPDDPDQAVARVLSAGGNLGPVRQLSAANGASSPVVAVDAVGNAEFVWGKDGDGLRVRSLSAAGIRGPVEHLTEEFGGVLPQVAMNPDGRAVAAWHVHGSESLDAAFGL